ncbi:metal-dependent phosphohydrolase [Micromonospora sp. C28SCA-DRY-2]|uniref:HD domain-containing protein n=1 Tax=Micromonospora sp. C28SCA-DRY-2 TaxID=3059522 RepID=UPI002676955F|nr:metal-dependent phosphohydrolase [Micromonospora sp. C28SCA-DRY-2]MDO3703842.1 metal-dependent phosphohydrolase [Micromonospora sp. C28SCA-DRY-2]
MVELIDRWRRAAREAGAPDGAALTTAGEELLARWREPHRHYHTPRHLTAVLDVVDAYAPLARRPDLVRLAAWCHDAVYDPRAAGDANERDSAALAGTLLTGLGVPAAAVAEVRRLVLLTAGHAVDPADADGALLCDADLAVLAAPRPAYDRYAAAVRREYGHVPEPAFRAGRARVLAGLLALPALFRLPPLARRWEAVARANLTRELAALTGPAPDREPT